jgi:hypothetical protein
VKPPSQGSAMASVQNRFAAQALIWQRSSGSPHLIALI